MPSAVLRAGHIVFLCALALLTLGVVMVQSASMSVDPVEVTPTSAAVVAIHQDRSLVHVARDLLASKSVAYAALAVAAMLITSRLPLGRLAGVGGSDSPRARGWGRGILFAGIVLLAGLVALVYVPGLGRITNGAHRWIYLPLGGGRELSIQPSEIAKWGMIVLLAAYAATHAASLGRFFRGLVPGLIALGLLAGLVAHEDLGTGVLIAGVGAVILLAGGAKLWHFLMFVPPAIAGFVFLVITSPYRLTRIETFLDPYADPKGAGFHMIQSMAAVAGGGGWGRGLGDGLQKFGYLPEDTTDFLFAIICEELGIAGAGLVIALYIGLLWAGLVVVRKQPSPMLKLIALGVVTTVGLQALINLAVVTGLGPTKGIALPLISSGGTGWILTAASLGLVVGMDRLASRGVTNNGDARRSLLSGSTSSPSESASAEESLAEPAERGTLSPA